MAIENAQSQSASPTKALWHPYVGNGIPRAAVSAWMSPRAAMHVGSGW